MASFGKAIETVLLHEGLDFTNSAGDRGGETVAGLTKKFLDSVPLELTDVNHDGKFDVVDMKRMTREEAIAIYKARWWDLGGYDNIKDDALATKLFDCAVNMGPMRAHKLMQQAYNRLVASGQLVVDGKLGPKSFAAFNSIDPKLLIRAFADEMWDFYQNIIKNDPTQAKWKNGWKNRAYALV